MENTGPGRGDTCSLQSTAPLFQQDLGASLDRQEEEEEMTFIHSLTLQKLV